MSRHIGTQVCVTCGKALLVLEGGGTIEHACRGVLSTPAREVVVCRTHVEQLEVSRNPGSGEGT
jgi:hypothetical protein